MRKSKINDLTLRKRKKLAEIVVNQSESKPTTSANQDATEISATTKTNDIVNSEVN